MRTNVEVWLTLKLEAARSIVLKQAELVHHAGLNKSSTTLSSQLHIDCRTPMFGFVPSSLVLCLVHIVCGDSLRPKKALSNGADMIVNEVCDGRRDLVESNVGAGYVYRRYTVEHASM